MDNKKTIISVLIILVIVVLGFVFIKPANVPQNPVSETPSGEQNPPSNLTQFGTTVSFKVGDQITFTDGLVAKLKDINDSRCPTDVECFWAGEIGATFNVSGGKLSKSGEIRLGMTTNKIISLENYTFTIINATPTYIDITVEYK